MERSELTVSNSLFWTDRVIHELTDGGRMGVAF